MFLNQKSIAYSYLLMVTILLCLPGSAFPKIGWFQQFYVDKWIHIGLFSTLCFLFQKSSLPIQLSSPQFWRIIVLIITYGIVMEFVQDQFIPNRSFELEDIYADTFGVFLGGWISTKWKAKK